MATIANRIAAVSEPQVSRESLASLSARLSELAVELERTAAAKEGAKISALTPEVARPRQIGSALAMARHAYWLRRQRAQIFGSGELFGEPAWDILLDLYIAHAEGKPVSVSSACIGSASPATTGLRWLAVLAEQGLIIREADQRDHRRIMVRLSESGVAAMERFLGLARGRSA